MINGAVFRIRHDADRLRVAEIAGERTLHLEHIALDDILRRRIMDFPREVHLTGHALLFVQLFRSFEIIHAMICRDMHLVCLEGLLRTGGLVDIRLESSREETLYRIFRLNYNRTGAIGGLDLLRFERGMVTDRVLINHVLHRGTTVTRCTFRIQRIEIRLIELRALRNITAGVDIRPAPVVIVRLIAARLFVDRRTHTPFELFAFQARRRIPIEGDIRDMLMVVVVLAFETDSVLHPVRVVTLGQNQLLTVIRTADDGATGMHIHVALALIVRGRVQTALHTRYRSDTVYTLVRTLRHLVP